MPLHRGRSLKDLCLASGAFSLSSLSTLGLLLIGSVAAHAEPNVATLTQIPSATGGILGVNDTDPYFDPYGDTLYYRAPVSDPTASSLNRFLAWTGAGDARDVSGFADATSSDLVKAGTLVATIQARPGDKAAQQVILVSPGSPASVPITRFTESAIDTENPKLGGVYLKWDTAVLARTSGDGRKVVYLAVLGNVMNNGGLAPGTSALFIYDTAGQTTARIPLAPDLTVSRLEINDDASTVMFTANQTNSRLIVHRYDVASGVDIALPEIRMGEPAVALSGNGRRIFFVSAEDLTGQNAGRSGQVFVWKSGQIRQITPFFNGSSDLSALPPNYRLLSRHAASQDGRRVVFGSLSPVSGQAGLHLWDDAAQSVVQIEPGKDSGGHFITYRAAALSSSGALVAFSADADFGSNPSHVMAMFASPVALPSAPPAPSPKPATPTAAMLNLANGVISSSDVILRAKVAGFTPSQVEFYQGDGSSGAIDVYLGSGTMQADGSYALAAHLIGTSPFTVYAVASNGMTKVTTQPITLTIGAAPVFRLGDVDGDGKINVQDATLVLQFVVGRLVPTPDQIRASDVNGDGKLSVADAMLILQVAVGLINRFPAKR